MFVFRHWRYAVQTAAWVHEAHIVQPLPWGARYVPVGGVPRQEPDTAIYISHARGGALSARRITRGQAAAQVPRVGLGRVYRRLWGGAAECDRAVVAVRGIAVRMREDGQYGAAVALGGPWRGGGGRVQGVDGGFGCAMAGRRFDCRAISVGTVFLG